MRSMNKALLGTALAVGALGFAAPPAHAAHIGIYVGVGGPGAYVPPCPGPGYEWMAGYWSNGYWVPGYWNYIGAGYAAPGYGFYGRGFYGDRDDFYRGGDWDRGREWGRGRDWGHDRFRR